MGIVTDSAVGVWLDFFTCFILNPKHQCKLNQKLSRRLCAQLCNKWGYQGLHTHQCIKRSGEQHQQPDIPGTFVPENICLCLGLLFLGHDFSSSCDEIRNDKKAHFFNNRGGFSVISNYCAKHKTRHPLCFERNDYGRTSSHISSKA